MWLVGPPWWPAELREDRADTMLTTVDPASGTVPGVKSAHNQNLSIKWTSLESLFLLLISHPTSLFFTQVFPHLKSLCLSRYWEGGTLLLRYFLVSGFLNDSICSPEGSFKSLELFIHNERFKSLAVPPARFSPWISWVLLCSKEIQKSYAQGCKQREGRAFYPVQNSFPKASKNLTATLGSIYPISSLHE